jgi:hypothetical protein
MPSASRVAGGGSGETISGKPARNNLVFFGGITLLACSAIWFIGAAMLFTSIQRLAETNGTSEAATANAVLCYLIASVVGIVAGVIAFRNASGRAKPVLRLGIAAAVLALIAIIVNLVVFSSVPPFGALALVASAVVLVGAFQMKSAVR